MDKREDEVRREPKAVGQRGAGRSRPVRTDEDGMWDSVDVAKYLKVSQSWVYRQFGLGLIPGVRLPGSAQMRFDPKIIKAYARGEWKPATVLPLKAG